METFPFVPRKLKQKATATTPQIQHIPTPSALLEPVLGFGSGSQDLNAEKKVVASNSSISKVKGKQKETTDVGLCSTLVSLALSDYNIWNDENLRSKLNGSDDGFIPISFLLNTSPILAGLAQTQYPLESMVVRSLRGSDEFEVRIALVEPDTNSWRNGSSSSSGSMDDGGYEVRRRDWEGLTERVRRYTRYMWDERTVYVENLPPSKRTITSIHTFIQDLFPSSNSNCEPGSSSSTDHSLLQHIYFPRHHNDALDYVPTKSKGFAFIIFSRAADAREFAEKWSWDRDARPVDISEQGERDASVEAQVACLRVLSMKDWEALREEYMRIQDKLREEVVVSAESPVRLRPQAVPQQTRDNDMNTTNNTSPQTSETWTYPPNCLVFVRNIHPETNKTTLRSLLANAFGGSVEEIDYVDYNKGLDSCHLRLKSPSAASRLVQYLSDNPCSQSSGLDNSGSGNLQFTEKGGICRIEAILIQGTKEEVYWEKVPEKVRKQALLKAYPELSRGGVEGDESTFAQDSKGKRETKRRKVS